MELDKRDAHHHRQAYARSSTSTSSSASSTVTGTSSSSSASSSTTPVLPLRRRRARRLRRPWHAAPAGGAMSREWPSRHMDWPGSKVIPHPTNLRPSSSQTNPTASRSHARRGSRVVCGAGLSGGVSWQALLSGSPPSAEAISSGAGSSTDTEGPRDLHEAWLNGGGVWRAATSIDRR